MTATIRLLRDRDLDGAARFLGTCGESGRGEHEARKWLRELFEDPVVVVVVARERQAVVGLALAATGSWSEHAGAHVCEVCAAAALQPRLRKSLELLLWAESLQRRAA